MMVLQKIRDVFINQKKERGFTLIEIMMVIAIGIIAFSYAWKAWGPSAQEGRISKANREMSDIRDTLLQYETYSGNQITDLSVVLNDFTSPTGVQYKSKMRKPEWTSAATIKDPWDTPYVLDTNNRTITSYGADKKAGGTNYDADIVYPY